MLNYRRLASWKGRCGYTFAPEQGGLRYGHINRFGSMKAPSGFCTWKNHVTVKNADEQGKSAEP